MDIFFSPKILVIKNFKTSEEELNSAAIYNAFFFNRNSLSYIIEEEDFKSYPISSKL